MNIKGLKIKYFFKIKKLENESEKTHALVMAFSYSFELELINTSGSPSHFTPS